MIANIIAGIVATLIIGGAIAYIIIVKKKGKKCIGCPDSIGCTGRCSSCSGKSSRD